MTMAAIATLTDSMSGRSPYLTDIHAADTALHSWAAAGSRDGVLCNAGIAST